MRLIKRLRNGKSVLSTINKAIDQGSAIAKEAIVDKDKFIALDHELQKIRAELLLSGKGGSITKITICGLVSATVITALAKFWIDPAAMTQFKDLAISITPILTILIGAYGTGKIIKDRKNGREK